MNRISKLFLNTFLLLILGTPLLQGQASLDKRTSLDVNAIPTADVLGSLAQTLGCRLEIDPAVNAPVTMRLPNVTVRTALSALCESIGCNWSLTGGVLHISAAPARKAGRRSFETFNVALKGQTPADFKFENAPLKSVLEALGKVSGIEITAEGAEASRPITVDLSNRSIVAALKEIGRAAELKSLTLYAGVQNGSRAGIRIKILTGPNPRATGDAPQKINED